MTEIVLDTNLLISANLSPNGKPAKILDMITDDKVKLYYSEEILAEYKDVLSRKKFNISPEKQEKLLRDITNNGTKIDPPISTIEMRDEKDRKFYDAAKESGTILVTGDKKDLLSLNEDFIMTVSDYLKEQERLKLINHKKQHISLSKQIDELAKQKKFDELAPLIEQRKAAEFEFKKLKINAERGGIFQKDEFNDALKLPTPSDADEQRRIAQTENILNSITPTEYKKITGEDLNQKQTLIYE